MNLPGRERGRVPPAVRTANLAIVFTDIKGFTERTSQQTLDENQRLLATHNGLLAPLFKAFGGRVIKSIGDAFLVTFESPTNAVLAGVAVQDKLWEYNRTSTPATRLDVRVAINVGEVRLEGGDVFGEPVNIASRVEHIAEAGEVFFTEAVYLAMNKAEAPAEEVGQFELKGIPGKVRVYKVPRAPHRIVAPSADQPASPTPADQPPFGNLALARIDAPGFRAGLVDTAELGQRAGQLASSAAHLASRAMEQGGAAMQQGLRSLEKKGLSRAQAGGAVLGVGVALALLAFALGQNEVEAAIDVVAHADREERWAKAEVARKLIAREKDAGRRSLYQGELGEALDESGTAVASYRAALKAGSSRAESRLLGLLGHPRCAFRAAAADAVADLKLKRAKGRLEDLAQAGGPDDGEQVLFLGCNSKNAAAAALKRLESLD